LGRGFFFVPIKKRKGAAKLPFYLNRHENLLSQNVPCVLNPKVSTRFMGAKKKSIKKAAPQERLYFQDENL